MDKLFTVREAAELLRISESTLNRMFAKKEIGRVKVAGRVMLSETHIQEYITQNTINADIQAP